MKRIVVLILVGVLAGCISASDALAGTDFISGKTVATLLSEFKTDINDSSTTFVSNAELVKWVNEAAIEINAKARCQEYSATVALATGVQEYSLTTATYDVETAIFDDGATDGFGKYALDRTDVKELYSQDQRKAGRPVRFYTWAGYIGFWPAPSSAENGLTVTVMGVGMPAEITATTQTLETPVQYDPIYNLYLKAKYYEKDGRENTANYYRTLFEHEINRKRLETSKKLVPDLKTVAQ